MADILEAASSKIDAAEASRDAALHDPLTGLANRSLILDHLQLALARAEPAILAGGGHLLRPRRLQADQRHARPPRPATRSWCASPSGSAPAVRPADTLGRWGGDEFVVVCEDLERASDAPAIAQRIAAAFEPPFSIQAMELHVGASIGVAVSGGGDDQPAALIDAADSAMYRAKQDSTAGGRPGRETTVFPIGVWRPKLEHLAGHLLDLLSGSERPHSPARDEESVPTGRTVT